MSEKTTKALKWVLISEFKKHVKYSSILVRVLMKDRKRESKQFFYKCNCLVER